MDILIAEKTNTTNGDISGILDLSVNFNPEYNLNEFNCTDFIIDMGNLIDLNIPESNGTWPFGGNGSNPGALGEFLRNIQPTNDISIDSNGGNAPMNNKNC